MDEASDDIPLPSAGPILVPAPACPHCQGTGVVREAQILAECMCLRRQRVLHYLTPTYGPQIAWDPQFQPEPYRGKDVFIQNPDGLPIPEFQRVAYALVKSFLLTTGLRLSHRTLTPYEVFRRLFETTDARSLNELTGAADVLILFFGGDEPRDTYATQLPWLIRKRRERHAATWLLMALGFDDSRFKKSYKELAEPLRECIADGSAAVPLPLVRSP